MRFLEMETLSFPEAAVPRDLRLQVLELQDQAWPEDEAQDRSGELQPSHDPALRPVSMLLVQDDRVLAARDAIADGGADLGIFTCDRPLQAFYEGCRWQTLEDTLLIGVTPDAPFSSDRFDKVTMAAFFSPRAREYAATFVRSRVGLYPGEIDRLW